MNVYEEDLLKAGKQIDWAKFKDKNILIAGVTGLVGKCLVDFIMIHNIVYNTNIKIYGIGRNRERAKDIILKFHDDNLFVFIEHDITNPLDNQIFCDVDYIIDAASGATPNVFAKNPVEVMTGNFQGAFNLLRISESFNSRFLYISSAEVYGNIDVKKKSEEDYGYINNIDIRAAYPISKKAAETLIISYGFEYGVDVVLARLCHTYGPTFTEHDNRAASEFIRNAQMKESITLKNDKPILRSYMYVVDTACAIIHLLDKGIKQEVYNISNDNSVITIQGFAEIVAKKTNTMLCLKKTSHSPVDGYTSIDRQVLANNKLISTGWEPLFDINTGIDHTISVLIEREIE